MSLQADFMSNVVELVARHILQRLAFAFELLVDPDRLLRHLLVRVFGATDQREVWPRGHALVSVAVQSDSEHQCFLLLL